MIYQTMLIAAYASNEYFIVQRMMQVCIRMYACLLLCMSAKNENYVKN